MNLPINKNTPHIMHIDLNSCFAMIEQQANPLLRNKPLVVAAYVTPNGCVLSPSTEAKKYGIKVGMTVRESRLLCTELLVREPDPPKYRDVHIRFRKIFQDYTPNVAPRSIDEAILDFSGMYTSVDHLVGMAREIKQRMRDEIGDWITCSIGIATNRFLAKTGASLHKPDGLDVITHENLLAVLGSLKLDDLYGIASKYEARLNTYGIFTPLQLFEATELYLKKEVFRSVVGYYWYLRLRGWEIDDVEWGRKSYGQQYAMGHQTADPEELSRILMKLCEKMGRRLRRSGSTARGIHVACVYKDHTHWHRGRKLDNPMYTTQELYAKAQLVFNQRPDKQKVVTRMAVSCFELEPSQSAQATLFDAEPDKLRKVSDAMDAINDKYGEFVITPALMMDMETKAKDAIAFGGVRELNDLY
jgi:DNA polymerase IV